MGSRGRFEAVPDVEELEFASEGFEVRSVEMVRRYIHDGELLRDNGAGHIRLCEGSIHTSHRSGISDAWVLHSECNIVVLLQDISIVVNKYITNDERGVLLGGNISRY